MIVILSGVFCEDLNTGNISPSVAIHACIRLPSVILSSYCFRFLAALFFILTVTSYCFQF